MREPHDRDLHRLALRRAVRICELRREGILVVDVDLHVRDHADDGQPAPLLQHPHAGIQDRLVAAEFVDDQPFQQRLLIRVQEHLRAQQLGKDAASVDIPRKEDRRADRLRESHVDDVVLFEVDLRRAPRAFDHDDVVLPRKGAVSVEDHRHQALFVGKISPCVHISQHFPVDDHLGSGVCRGLEQYRIHPHVRQDAGRLRLHDLRAAHLQPVCRDIGVERHILRFKRGDPVSVLPEDPAQPRCEEALSGVGHGPLDHDRSC